AEATVYLATAPKSNRVYEAFGRATDAAAEHPTAPVPLHIRNAPTKLMEELGYGAGYKYAHAYADAYVPQDYLPEALRGAKWYEPHTFRSRSTRMEVAVDLEETHFGTALLERPLDLSPENHSRVTVPTRFEWAGMGAGARALLTKRAVGYGLVGKVILDTPLGD